MFVLLDRPPIDDDVVLETLGAYVLAREQQRGNGRIVRQALELALLAKLRVVRVVVDALAVLALAELVQRAVALEEVEAIVHGRDSLEVALHRGPAERELLDDHAAPIVDLRDLRVLVAVCQQATIG